MYVLYQTISNRGVIISRTLNWRYSIQIHFKYQKKQVVSSNATKTKNETCSEVLIKVWISLLAPKSKLLKYSFLLPCFFMNMPTFNYKKPFLVAFYMEFSMQTLETIVCLKIRRLTLKYMGRRKKHIFTYLIKTAGEFSYN